MLQGKAHPWIHVLVPALLAVLRTLGDAPTRSLAALAQRLGVLEAAPTAAPASPLVPMMGRNGALSAPKTLLHRGMLERQEQGPHRQKCPAGQCPPHSSF